MGGDGRTGRAVAMVSDRALFERDARGGNRRPLLFAYCGF